MGVKGRCGRKAIPNHLHVIHGNPGHRNLKAKIENEPKVETPDECPQPTKKVCADKEAKKCWLELAPQLYDAGLFTNIEVQTFERYCIIYGHWSYALKMLRKEGWFVFNKKTRRSRLSVWIKLSDAYERRLMAYITEFGLSPSSRSRISMPARKKNEDEFGSFMKSKRG